MAKHKIKKIDHAADLVGRRFRYYDFAMAAFVTVLLCSNILGAAKRAQFFEFDLGPFHFGAFGAGILFFPLSYLLGDVLTEVYGYARARRVVWAGFGAIAFMAFMSWFVVAIPPAPGWEGQAAYESVFGLTPRIVIASMVAFWAGEFANSYVLAQMKIMSEGKNLWMRTIGSTAVGQLVDSMLFYPIAFLFAPGWTTEDVMQILVTNYLLKVLWEAALTPVTYRIVGWLKSREGVDVYDKETDFTPFSIKS
jgi:uncharacterized integral membrane protein (TIGR00697 family)